MNANRWVAAAFVAVALGAVGGQAPADAAFPGRNGLIVFSAHGAENRLSQLYAVSANGGTSRNLTRTPAASHLVPTPSPDGTRIAFVAFDRGTELWTMRTDGSDRRRLAASSGSPPAWSPDGRWLAYQTPEGSLAAVEPASGRTVSIVARGEFPAWSPDGRKIAFVRDWSYFVVTDGVERQVAVDLRQAMDTLADAPSWAPDSRRFVVAARAVDGTSFSEVSDLYIVDAVSGAASPLTSTTTTSEGTPRWSPDGTRIVFTYRHHNIAGQGLGLLAPEGGPLRVFGANGAGPEWSPDGRRIAFVRAGHVEIANLATGATRRVTRHTRRERVLYRAVWSPDGRTLYYDKAAENVRDLFTIAASGGPARRLTTSPSWDVDPRWSPDGRRLVFSRGNPYSVLYVVGANGRGLRRLGCPPRSECRAASWSPDGRRIAFFLLGDGGRQIAVVRADGVGRRAVAQGLFPTWSPEGRRIAFSNDDGDIVSVRPDGSRRSILVRGDPWYRNDAPAWSPDGRWLAFVRSHFECAGCENALGRTIVVARGDGTAPRDLGIAVGSRVTWSPDGRQLVFDHGTRLAVANPDGSGLRTLTTGLGSDLQPDWQPLRRR